jgi:DNA mismatch repair protein MLH1
LVDFLHSRAEILLKGFGIKISEAGNIEALPLLIKGYDPALLRLPFFLLRLGTEVDWGDEVECFKGISTEIALLYQVYDDSMYQSGIIGKSTPNIAWLIQHILLPAMKQGFKVPTYLSTNGSIVQIAALEKLYKIFERC